MAEQITRAEYERKFGSQPIKITREEYNRKFMDDLVGEQDSNYSGREFRGVDETINRISTAYNEPVTEGVPDILKPTASVLEGAADFTLGAGAGVNDVLSSLAGLLGADTVAALLKQGADDLRAKQFKSKSEGGIMSDAGQMSGEEAVYTTGGGAVGKLFGDAISGGAKLLSNRINSKADAGVKLFGDIMKKRASNNTTPIFASGNAPKTLGERPIGRITQDMTEDELIASTKAAMDNMKPAQLGLVSEAIGKISPTAQKIIDKYYDKLASPFSSKAAFSDMNRYIKEMKDLGYTQTEAVNMFKQAVGQNIDLTKAGTATGALFGTNGN